MSIVYVLLTLLGLLQDLRESAGWCLSNLANGSEKVQYALISAGGADVMMMNFRQGAGALKDASAAGISGLTTGNHDILRKIESIGGVTLLKKVARFVFCSPMLFFVHFVGDTLRDFDLLFLQKQR